LEGKIGSITNSTVPGKRRSNMKRLTNSVLALRVWRDTRGQDLVEYALAAGLVAVAAVACMPGLSGTVNNVFTKIGSIINSSVQ
jgi:pilus assembly protein Flp/PilA